MTEIKLFILMLMCCVLTPLPIYSQQKDELYKQNKAWRKAESENRKGDILKTEKYYREALHFAPGNAELLYNLGNVLMTRNKYFEALDYYQKSLHNTKNDALKASAYHNAGNAYMELRDYNKAIEAYKNSLRLDPNNDETRYNLALAMLYRKNSPDPSKNNHSQDQKQKNNSSQNNQNQNNENQNNKNRSNQEKNKQNQDSDKSGNEKKKKDNNGENSKNKEEKQKNSPENNPGEKQGEKQKESQSKNSQNKGDKEGKISPVRMERLLKAMENEEKKTLKKVRFKKARIKTKKNEKDW